MHKIKQQAHHIMGTLMLSSAVLLSLGPLSAQAAGPTSQQREQVAGYAKMPLGQFTVTALYDGFVDISPTLLSGAPKKTINASLSQSLLRGDVPTQTAVNAFLVHTDKNVILVDAGTAKLFGDHLGFVSDNLRAAGYTPEQVDTVLLTHLHPDHAGGLLTPNGKMAFPNAHVFVSKADADFWLDPVQAANAPKEQQALFKMAVDAVAPYIASGKLTIFETGQTLRDGVIDIPASGHTSGHTAYLFTSQGQRLMVWGDIVHNVAVQLAHPEVAIDYDWDKKQAVATRRTLLAMAHKQKLWIAAAHIPFPGIGRIGTDKTHAYRWVPIDYQPLSALD